MKKGLLPLPFKGLSLHNVVLSEPCGRAKIMSLKSTIIFLVWLLPGILNQVQAQQVARLQSPDKSIALQVYLSASGEMQYKLERSGVTIIHPSALGVMMKGHDFTRGMKLVGTSKPQRITDSYQTKNAKKSSMLYQANQLVMSFLNEEGKKMDLIFRLSNDGAAFRYSFPWINSKETIVKEHSSFAFDKNAKAWLQPMSEAKTGWQHCHPSYEEHYLQNIAVGAVSPLKSGWVYPALFKNK